jgi:DNA-directed RNA polymerase subunit E"
MVKEFACRKCKTLTTEKVCPNCGSTELSDEWSGLIIIVNPEKSQVARTLGITKQGRYALKVS